MIGTIAEGARVLGTLLGWGMAGPFGVILGFGGGIALGANFLAKNRYYR